MSSRALVLWIALQSLLGLWFAWLLWGAPIEASAPLEVLPQARDTPRSEPLDARIPDEPLPTDSPSRQLADIGTDRAADPITVLLYGRITDPDGNPVEKALLSIRQQDEHRGAVESGPSGAYSLTGLLPGDAALLVRTTAFRNYEEDLVLEGASQRHDIVLRRAVVLQVVARTPEGKPFEQELRAAGIDDRIHPSAIATRTQVETLPVLEHMIRIGVGRFRHARWYGRENIEDAPPELLGTLDIDGDLPVWVSLVVGPAILGTQLAEPGRERVEFTLGPEAVRERLGSIRLQLVSAATGQPLPAVSISGPGTVAITDAEGVARFENVAPGLHRLTVHPWKVELDQLVRIEPGQELDLGRLALREPLTVSGVVLDPQGEPVSATISWDDLDRHAFPQPLRDNRTTGSDAQGKWRVLMSPHRHALHATLRDRSQAAHVLLDLTTGLPKEGMRIQLRPTVQVELVRDFGRDRVYLLSIRTRQGVPVYGDFVHAGFEQSIRLPAGEYLADVHEDLTLVRSFAFTVGSTKTQIRIP